MALKVKCTGYDIKLPAEQPKLERLTLLNAGEDREELTETGFSTIAQGDMTLMKKKKKNMPLWGLKSGPGQHSTGEL